MEKSFECARDKDNKISARIITTQAEPNQKRLKTL